MWILPAAQEHQEALLAFHCVCTSLPKAEHAYHDIVLVAQMDKVLSIYCNC